MTEPPPSGGREAILALLPHLRAYARSLTGGHADLADDLVQDTLMLALQAWDRFEPGTNLKAWLFRILHNRFHSVVARRHVTAEVGVEDLSLYGAVPAVQEGRAELRHFKAAFAALRPVDREMLVLHAVHGLPLEEIAAACGCTVQAAKSRMNRARTKLKAMLLGDGRAATSPIDRRARTPSPDGRSGAESALVGKRAGPRAAVSRSRQPEAAHGPG